MKGMMGTGRIARGSLVALSALLALGLGTVPAFAATIVVPNDFPTIQGAIDAAASGDTVVVKKGGGLGPNGEYHEDVDIDDKKIFLKCERGAVLDGAIPSDVVGGPDVIDGAGIHIDDENVAGSPDGSVVSGCTIQNFADEGIRVNDHTDDGDGVEITIVNNLVLNNGCEGITVEGKNFLIKNNTAIRNGFDEQDGECEAPRDGFRFRSSSSGGIGSSDGTVVGNVAISNARDGFNNEGSSDSKRIKFLRNRANKNKDDGFDINGEDHTLRGNRAELNEEDGFDFDSPLKRALVERNLARGNDDDGFEIEDVQDSTIRRNVAINNEDEGFDFDNDSDGDAHGNLIDRNIAIGNENQGFKIRGDRNTVTNNRAIENKNDGFDFNCDEDESDPGVTCTMEITNNRSLRNTDDGFELEDFDKSSVYENQAIGNEENGFDCSICNDVVFSNNLARDNGRHGFRDIFGGKNTYKGNRSIRNGRDGFQINDAQTSTMSLIKNTSRRNNGDGIDINDGPSVDFIIDGNIVRNNRGTGIESNGGSDVVIKNNTMKGNRTDLAGKGDTDAIGCSGADAADDGFGNTFTTGGFGVCTPGTGDE